MDRKDGMPMWVFIAVVNFTSRKLGVGITLATLVFGLCCIPMPLLLESWAWDDAFSWYGTSILIAGWYWAGIRWVDFNSSWDDEPATEQSVQQRGSDESADRSAIEKAA